MNILSLFRSKKVRNEIPYFRNNFKRYYAKEMEDDTVEFWCHLVRERGWGDDRSAYYLGKYDTEIIRAEDFYRLPWDVQRSAERLFAMR